MSQTVYDQLASKKESLADRFGLNPELGNVVLALLGRLVIICQERGKPIEGIIIGPIATTQSNNKDLTLRAHVIFGSVAVSRSAMWQLQTDFAKYAQSKAAGLALALQRNPTLANFFEDLAMCVDNWSKEIRLPFENIKVKQSIISVPGDIFVLKLGKELLDA